MRLPDRIALRTTAALLGAAMVTAVSASARAERTPCPEVRVKASAAAHAFCWFEAYRLGSDLCERSATGDDECIVNAASWCESAALDESRVADACFLSYLRSGRFDQARETAAYLQTPAEEAERCRRALSVVSVRIVSNPAGATIEADGREYGEAPVEVKLTGQWWTKEVVAVFDTVDGDVEVEVTGEQLIDAFDPYACVMGDLVVTGPESAPAAPVQESAPGSDSGGGGRLWTWVALGGAGAFGAAALVFWLNGDAQYEALGETCESGCTDEQIEEEIDDSGVQTSDLLTNVSLGLSGALLTTAVVLFFVEGDGGAGADESAGEMELGAGPGGILLRGAF
jgi:hypothetical protein